MEKEKIITELYSLRAGLSLIAKENDLCNSEIAAAVRNKNSKTAQARAIADRKTEQANYAVTAATTAKEAVERECEENEKVREEKSCSEMDFEGRKIIMHARLIFGILFILLYLASAGLSYYNIYRLDFKGYIFIPILIVSLGMGITEFAWLYNLVDDINTNSENFPIILNFFIFLIYAFNSATYFAMMIIGFKGVSVNTAMIAVIAVAAGMCAVTSTICTILCHKDDYEWAEIAKRDIKRYGQAESELSRLEKEYDRIKSEAASLNRKYEDVKRVAEDEYNAACEKYNEQCKAVCTVSAKLHNSIGTEIWKTLVDTYGSLLDVRDWKILDIVIWQLETGRADTVKEALQLADRETQTGRIVSAINSASYAIKQQIQTGFGSLQSQLNYNFNALAREFEATAGGITNGIALSTQALRENQTNYINAIYRSIDKIVSQTSLQTALLEKAGTSSESLVAAVKKLQDTQSDLNKKLSG